MDFHLGPVGPHKVKRFMALEAEPTDDKAAPDKTSAARAGVTPMMAQFLEIKSENQEALLFYRMGDFYELFFEDAVKAARALDITLTKRGRHLGEDIPMCGVPVHAAESYLERLIRAGFKVAVCEQTEYPAEAKKRGSKSVVAREVVRLVTPGTLTEDTLLDARAHNYLAAISCVGGRSNKSAAWALAWLDMSTGDFTCTSIEEAALGAELARLSPSETLIADTWVGEASIEAIGEQVATTLTALPTSKFESGSGEKQLKELFDVKSLDGFGDFSRAELGAAGALVGYIELTQRGKLPALKPLAQELVGGVVSIDAATRANLELTQTLSGQRKGSLLSVIDRTVTGPGARTLAKRLSGPLRDPSEITCRLDSVEFFLSARDLRGSVRAKLKETPDMARALTRLSLGRGGPRDLAAIGKGLRQGFEIGAAIAGAEAPLVSAPQEVNNLCADLSDGSGTLQTLALDLGEALAKELPLLARDGGFIAKGYNAALDEVRKLRDESRRVIAVLESKYRDTSGVQSLKIKHNNVLGFFIEVTALHGDKLMTDSETFIHRQTLASAVRFTTTELSDLATSIANASGRAVAFELELFEKLCAEVLQKAIGISAAAMALAKVDVSASLATLAEENRLSRPKVDNSLSFEVRGGRHPVVEAALRHNAENPFVANDCLLSSEDGDPGSRRLWLVTGPNMAGKSTFLRQNALIALMAQMGSFVPAEEAHIGVVDRLFSRVGAADDLARGRSTFMVEMVETAAILNQAGPHSLVILDEIGRGTATFDGLSIAWAAVEYLHDINQCRALFATHYHELTALNAKLGHLSNVTMRVKEWQGDVVFLHEVVPGKADRSYGIQVAKLAGLPAAVIERASLVLEKLEEAREEKEVNPMIDDLPLFSATVDHVAKTPKGPSALDEAFADINPDDLSPKEALELIYKLKLL